MDEAAALKKTQKMVLRLLTYRARSIREIYDYLERRGFKETVIEKTISKMKSYGYLDDHQYASDYIDYRKYRGYGLKRIQYELNMKGIDKNIIYTLIADKFNQNEDLMRVKSILSSRFAPDEAINEKWLARQVAFLKRRGFQDNLIWKALKEYKDNDYFFTV